MSVCGQALHGKPSLVLHGHWADVSNISDEHRFLNDEALVINGKEVLRQKGQSAGQLAWHLVELRKNSDQARKMMDEFDIYQQPSAVVDRIIFKYQLKKHQARYKASLALRDLYSGCLAEESKLCCALANQLCSYIRGKMTAAQQVTDTDVAFELKAYARVSQQKLRRELRQKAEEEGVKPIYKCGTYEILRVSYEALMMLKEKQHGQKTLLAAARRNGWLSYRPNLRTQQFERADSQEWAKNLPEGSHRLRSSWFSERYTWLEDGKPKLLLDDSKLEQQVDPVAFGGEGAHLSLSAWTTEDGKAKAAPEPELVLECTEVDEDVGARQLAENLRSSKDVRRKIALDKNLTSQKKTSEMQEVMFKRQKIQTALREARKCDMKDLRELMSQFSRRQLFDLVIPQAGKSGQKRATSLSQHNDALKRNFIKNVRNLLKKKSARKNYMALHKVKQERTALENEAAAEMVSKLISCKSEAAAESEPDKPAKAEPW